MRRSIALFVPLALLLALTLVRQKPPSDVPHFRIAIEKLAFSDKDRLEAFLGPFRLEGA